MILADDTLENLRERTGQTDLDDIFVFYVNATAGETEVKAHEF
jgi:hypothetical protein